MWGLVKFVANELREEAHQGLVAAKAKEDKRRARSQAYHYRRNTCQQWANRMSEEHGQDYHKAMHLCRERGWKVPARSGL